ncbi:BA14K family protein [Acuticoccus sp. MNP-M23]|uniref:BA14K family protein n=1 Tax=Acuticoccus sp. MNP-M23 TaxID=3072793 RepID=UPI00281522CF|nr:BA14K family protein [Acuticoccus sp. MNP-M23]WMS44165.1 BA14K family protein [Acuticoccus sp. MNP-M23]
MGTASAAVHGGPTPLTITPHFADVMANAATEDAAAGEGVQVAETARQRRLRIRRQERRRANRRATQRNRQVRRNVRRNTRRRVARQERNRIYRNNRWYYYNDGGWYDNNGAALAAGLVGLAAGAAIAGSVNRQPEVVVVEPGYGVAPYSSEWYRRCDMKYNSFRASDGTYLGYDGVRHTCRLP